MLSCVYRRSRHRSGSQCLVRCCVLEQVAAGDMAEAGQAHAVGALGVVVSGGSPAVGDTKADVVRRVVARVDDRGVRGLRRKVLECALVGAGGLAVDLDLVAAVEGRDPVVGPRGEFDAAGDADVGAGVVDGQLARADLLAVVAADLGPLEDVFTIGDPRRDLHVHALAKVGVAGVKAVAVAVTSVALALDD